MPVQLYEIVLLCLAAFIAGLVDAIVGGGGLIQTPASLVILPDYPVAVVLGTVKIPSFSGTAFAAVQYIRKVDMKWRLLVIFCTTAFFAAYAGSKLLTVVTNSFMKPILLFVLFAVAVYTFSKKDFGQQVERYFSPQKELFYGSFICFIIGFYDGFIGPGTGSFLILAFIALLGFDFLHASAHAKMVNLATNLWSIILFTMYGKIIWAIAVPMALSNAVGGAVGARLVIKKGNKFIRIFFLFIVIATLLRFMYDVFIAGR